jgi:hypothetical protein
MAGMNIRGELTQQFQRQGERRVREDDWFDEESDVPPAAARAPRRARPPTLFEAGPWRARIGCVVDTPPRK